MTRPTWRKDSSRTRRDASFMHKATIWAGVPAVATVLGVALWFTLVPGRSGAG